MKLYYYVKDSEKVGPYTLEELRTKNITTETLIWHEGLPSWIRAKDSQDLNSFFSLTPPSIPPTLVSAPSLNPPEFQEVPYDNKRMFKNPFNSKGRIRRTEYLLSYIITWLYWGIVISILHDPYSDGTPDGTEFVTLVLLIPSIWFLAVQSAKRCHDLGNSGWFQFIPFYHFILLFSEGSHFPNIYGPSPK